MALRRDTEWNRTTVQKAKASMIVGPDADAPAGSYRRVRLVLRAGTISCRIMEAGYKAGGEIGDSRTNEWPEEQGPSDTLHFRIRPEQTVWAIVSNETTQGGVVKLSVIIEYHEGRA